MPERASGEGTGERSVVRIYVDSNIFLNVLFEELLRSGQVFYYSRRLLERVLECKFHLVVSELTVSELARKTGLGRSVIVNDILRPYDVVGKLTILKVTAEDVEEAVYLSSTYGLHRTDALHATMSKQHKCILVTRDRELILAATRVGIRAVTPERIT